MKKLGKLEINSSKLIKREELLNLRGGSGTCYNCWQTPSPGFLGIIYGTGLTEEEAMAACSYSYPPYTCNYVTQTECP